MIQPISGPPPGQPPGQGDNLPSGTGNQPLSSQQRTSLESLMTKVTSLTQQQRAELWAGIRHDIGLSGDSPLLSRHFPAAEHNLAQRLLAAQKSHSARQLLAQLGEYLRLGNNRQAVTDYIRHNFGQTPLNQLSPEQRNYEPQHSIDAGFLNYRRLYLFVPEGMRRDIEQRMAALPRDMAAHFKSLNNDYSYISASLSLAKDRGARTISEILASEEANVGDVVASTDRILGDASVYSNSRVEFQIHTECGFKKTAWIQFSTKNIKADTTKMQLDKHYGLSFVGIVDEVTADQVFVAPLVMGTPWLNPNPSSKPDFDMMLTHYEFFESFIEDIDEFKLVRSIPRDESGNAWKVLRHIPENSVKTAICSILKETPSKDWSGETSDHFSTSIHLSGRRVSAAFLLKGPSRFFEMKAAHLGKNGDQIVRLTNEPAQLFILQHSHLVSPAVRATLRAFSVNPCTPRRYCVIDGPDTFRLLKAYGQLPVNDDS